MEYSSFPRWPYLTPRNTLYAGWPGLQNNLIRLTVTMTTPWLLPWQRPNCYHDNALTVTMTTPWLLPWQRPDFYHDNALTVTMTTPWLLPRQRPDCYHDNALTVTMTTSWLLPWQRPNYIIQRYTMILNHWRLINSHGKFFFQSIQRYLPSTLHFSIKNIITFS